MSEETKNKETPDDEKIIDAGNKCYLLRRKDNVTTVIKKDKETGTEQLISRCLGVGNLDDYEFDSDTEKLRTRSCMHRKKITGA